MCKVAIVCTVSVRYLDALLSMVEDDVVTVVFGGVSGNTFI